MRIALIGDSHGHLPALEAVLAACHTASPDLIIHCGDLLTVPLSPDPLEESFDLLRAEGVWATYGNHDLTLRSWGTPEWIRTLALREARGHMTGSWGRHVAAGQAQLRATDLAWLRTLPSELCLPRCVYVTHSLPGNPFLSLAGDDQRERGVNSEQRRLAFTRPGVAAAEVILCGHAHSPKAFWRGRQFIVRTGAVIGPNSPLGTVVRQGEYTIVTRGRQGWEVRFGTTHWRPRDPSWTWRSAIVQIEDAGPDS